jgi:hypothetical protein
VLAIPIKLPKPLNVIIAEIILINYPMLNYKELFNLPWAEGLLQVI